MEWVVFKSVLAALQIEKALTDAHRMLIKGETDPETTTAGYIGQKYLNTVDGGWFKLSATDGVTYTWTKLIDYTPTEQEALQAAVPETRTINGEALTGDITLTGAHIGLTGMIEAETYTPITVEDSSNTAFGKVKKFLTDFAASVRGVLLDGLSTASSTAVLATDSILIAIGKLQAQVTARVAKTLKVNNQALSADVAFSASSTTAAATSTKVVTPIGGNVTLADGTLFTVRFAYANTAATVALNVGGVTKPVSITNAPFNFLANIPYLFVYYADAGGHFELVTSTKASIGLWNVDNTSDESKPISTAVGAAMDDLSDLISTNMDVAIPNLITNGNFASGTTGWLTTYGSVTALNNILTVTGVSSFKMAFVGNTLTNSMFSVGNKVYIRSKVRSTNADCVKFAVGLNITRDGSSILSSEKVVNTPMQNQWYAFSGIYTVTTEKLSPAFRIFHEYIDAATANGKAIEVDGIYGVNCINLSEVFGVGNEPTVTEMDAIVGLVPNQWWNGTLTPNQELLLNWQLGRIRQNKVDINELEAALDLKDSVIYDQTVNAAFLSGTWTADADTDTLTCSVAHGLAADAPVSFLPQTGVLPGGISSEAWFYYVESVPTPQTLKIKLTRTGTAVNITSNGTAGWGIRPARASTLSIPLNFILYDEVDIYSNLEFVPNASAGNAYLALYLTPSATIKITLNDANVYGAADSALLYTSVTSKKYVKLSCKVNIRKLYSQRYHIQIDIAGQTSDNADMSAPTPYGRIFTGFISGADLTTIRITEAYSDTVKNGTRYIAVRR